MPYATVRGRAEMSDGTEHRPETASDISEDRSGRFRDVTGAKLPPEYSFIRMLGQGSMAHVFLARNVALKRLVAIKVLRRELANDPVGRKRFVREAQAAARISHPSVTSVYTVGTLSNNIPFIEMQFIEGSNLAELLRSQGRFEVSAARELLTQISAALAAAHDCRVIHRDVKPANVLVEAESGRAYLTDFGVAGILESGSEEVTRLTRDGERFGDPTYMSPEQLRGEVLTPQTDIYSLGVLACKILTTYGPFGDSEITDMAGAHIRRAPINLHELRPDVPSELGNAVQRCLAKKPEHRPHAGVLAKIFAGTGEMDADEDEPVRGALAGFLGELKNRKVYRAMVAYAAATFVVLQAADLILPPLDVPVWIYRSIVLASLAGFPVTLVLAWVFDIRQGRLMRAEDVDTSFTRRVSPKQRLLLQVLGLILSIAISAATAWWLLASG